MYLTLFKSVKNICLIMFDFEKEHSFDHRADFLVVFVTFICNVFQETLFSSGLCQKRSFRHFGSKTRNKQTTNEVQ